MSVTEGNGKTFAIKNDEDLNAVALFFMTALAFKAAEDVNQHSGDGLRHLKAWREYRGLSVNQAAQKIGCTAMIIRNWEGRARNWPKSFWLPCIAKAYGCTIEELYFPPPGDEK